MENQDKDNLIECEKPNWFQKIRDRLIAFFSKKLNSKEAEIRDNSG